MHINKCWRKMEKTDLSSFIRNTWRKVCMCRNILRILYPEPVTPLSLER